MGVSSGASIQVTGLRELRSALKRVSAELPAELARASQQAAGIVVAEARRRAPAGPHQGGGRIVPVAQSVRALKQGVKGVVAAGGARTPHAGVYEFGGSIPRRGRHAGQAAAVARTHRSFRLLGTPLTHIAKRAYVYPALDAKRDEVIRVYGELLDRLLNKAASGSS